MTLGSFESAFHRLVAQKINEHINETALNLVDGKALGRDLDATGLAYSREVGYIAGLREALKICVDIEDELTGKRAPKKK